MRTGRLVVGITGASGAIYADRFVKACGAHFDEILAIVSKHALSVFATELDRRVEPPLTSQALFGEEIPSLRFLDGGDYFTPPASGSYRHDGMVIVPCSMGTVGRIANGVSDDLMTRAADVCLKEGRPLILVVRETPLNLVHLRNLTRLAEAGAVVLPAAPAWYNRPRTLEDLADTIVARILQRLGIEQKLVPEWAEE
ncbi:MAG: UbiX family flavin prenyltransferase [Armatimonadetes bacterium]|nr:MAG: UbiX family flavin prenyltransferase [Armatimonadota bacterium]